MPKIHNLEAIGRIDAADGIRILTGSLELEAGTDITVKPAPGKPSGGKDPIFNVVPTGSFTGSYDPSKPIGILEYGLNNVQDPPLRPGSQNQLIGYGRWNGAPRDYALRLPSPSVGASLQVKNESIVTLRIFPSASGGQIGLQPRGAEYKMYPGPYKAIFTCVTTGSSGEGTWTLQHATGTSRTLINTFYISHTSGSATVAAVPLDPPATSTNVFDNVAVGTYGFIDINGQGIASKGFIYPSSSLIPGSGIPLFDFAKAYPDPVLTPPADEKDPNEYMDTLGDNGKIEYITGVRLHTNVTSSDYYPNSTPSIPNSNVGGLCLFGYYSCIDGFNSVRSVGNAPYLPMIRDVNMDQVNASFGIMNYDGYHACRRVLPQENPPPFSGEGRIGQLYTEYFNDALANNSGGGGFDSNPMPVGSFLNFTADYNFGSNGLPSSPLTPHVPGNAWNIVIPAHYKTKTYQFRLETDVYTAN